MPNNFLAEAARKARRLRTRTRSRCGTRTTAETPRPLVADQPETEWSEDQKRDDIERTQPDKAYDDTFNAGESVQDCSQRAQRSHSWHCDDLASLF